MPVNAAAAVAKERKRRLLVMLLLLQHVACPLERYEPIGGGAASKKGILEAREGSDGNSMLG